MVDHYACGTITLYYLYRKMNVATRECDEHERNLSILFIIFIKGFFFALIENDLLACFIFLVFVIFGVLKLPSHEFLASFIPHTLNLYRDEEEVL